MSHEYERDLSAAESLGEVGDIVRQAARRECGRSNFRAARRQLCFYADEDAIAPRWKGQRLPMQQCISGWAMLNKQSVAVPDIERDERSPIEAYRPTFVRNLVMVPIDRRNPVGAIGAYRSWTGGDTAAPNFSLGRGADSRQLQAG
jgi:GAF domain-containing protein